jgi:hypothetical protein
MQVSVSNQNEVLSLLHPERLKRLTKLFPGELIDAVDTVEVKLFELSRTVEDHGLLINLLTEARIKRDRQVEALLFLHGLTGE